MQKEQYLKFFVPICEKNLTKEEVTIKISLAFCYKFGVIRKVKKKKLLPKETVCICERQLIDDDIVVRRSKKQFGIGAVPSENVPQKVKEIKVCKLV